MTMKIIVFLGKKIIVFEDIDCIGDIILNRKEKKKNKKYNTPFNI